jgi:bifunctional DNA-binding transcriptional regulator/antitoxin component of YhaV-PrlF toxin-antitoxin module
VPQPTKDTGPVIVDSPRNHHIPRIWRFDWPPHRLDRRGSFWYNGSGISTNSGTLSSWLQGSYKARFPGAANHNFFHDSIVVAGTMSMTRTTSIEPGYRIQLPAEWAEALGLKDQVNLAMTAEGILVHTVTRVTWDDIFATRLSVRPGDSSTSPEITEVSGDDLLF